MGSSKLAFASSLVLTLFACASTVQAQVNIPTSQNAGAIGQGMGAGLNGFYYGTPSPGANADADAYIATHPPVATFVSTVIDYPGGNTSTGDGTTLATFLGGDATTLSNPGVGANNLSGQLFHFTGYLAIVTPGTYNFTLNSDDGSRLNIGGVTVDDNGGDHGYGGPTNSALFATAGLYPLDVIYYEHGGATGVALLSDLTGSSSVIPTSLLFQRIGTQGVPEPSSVALLLSVSMTGAGFLMRRKRAR